MAGHSKWNNIKRKKGAADAQRGKIFTKLGREIQVAVKQGGADPVANRALQDAIAKAKSNNMPNDTIQRSIAKAAGVNDTDDYEEVVYEGYGINGVAVMVRTLTDNRNRTAGDIRHLFDKYGGNLGTSGCVAFQFETKGSLIIERENFPDEETCLLDALEAGADDVEVSPEYYEIVTSPDQYHTVLSELSAKGYAFADVSLGPVPLSWTEVSGEDEVKQLQTMLDKLEDHEDVQEVYHNWEQDE